MITSTFEKADDAKANSHAVLGRILTAKDLGRGIATRPRSEERVHQKPGHRVSQAVQFEEDTRFRHWGINE